MSLGRSQPVRHTVDWPAIASVVMLVGLFGLVQGLTYPLLALVLETAGRSSSLIGINTAMTPLGLILSAPMIPALAARFGAVRVASIGVFSIAFLLITLGATTALVVWFPVRFLLGGAINAVFITAEAWINQLAPTQRRGLVLGVFSTFLSIGFAAGPFVIVVAGSQGWTPFLIAVAFALVAGVTLIVMRGRLPRFVSGSSTTIRSFLAVGFSLCVVVAIAAAFDQATLSLLPIYGIEAGRTEQMAAGMLTVLIAGNIFLQTPIGALTDQIGTRRALATLCAIVTIGALAIPIAFSTWPIWPILFLWGAAGYGIYTVALVALGHRFTGPTLLAGNAAFAFFWGIGGAIGPPALGGLMDALGADAFFVGIAVGYASLMVVTLLRKTSVTR